MGTSITKHYGIAGPVPFADIDVDCDNKRFLDAHIIRRWGSSNPHAATAVLSFDTFFDTISLGAMSSAASAREQALDLLTHFEEPWETRLGMAAEGFAGHGGAEDIGSRIWHALCNDLDALLRVGVLKHLEELPLFVEGVDRDITSDMTTRIAFGALADFTADMLVQYPEFTAGSHQTGVVERQVWDPSTLTWALRPVELPIVNGKPLLLVPAEWVRSTLLLNARRFYETSVLSYAQGEQVVFDAHGKPLRTPKYELKRQEGLARGRETNREVTLRADRDGQDLLAIFRGFVAERLELAKRAAA
ncbi:hypothetical protein SA2016_0835 [Sinomonas atrocyanea]|uniref:Uncharacterized protein n=1 Tax=Sinomonas atrocyanea TaxID=37927 RepID=A0A126ZWQ1_9MICC|nr:hypothetical protein [Sinomonas atrocyanea]AMM31523.1 hypothetical protein SA2016_0835 [Sinomonas atrocyanea]GEB65089.1 hypothetical protein SAT01_25370 [Sinomonas atrocyanea]GGG63361.1 hypothetical protein GCM10007172_13260 [Sinomonas atrocyanea]